MADINRSIDAYYPEPGFDLSAAIYGHVLQEMVTSVDDIVDHFSGAGLTPGQIERTIGSMDGQQPWMLHVDVETDEVSFKNSWPFN